MAAEIDFRLKLDAATFCALAAHARAHGTDKQDIAREVLGEWARRQIHGAKMLDSIVATQAAEFVSVYVSIAP